MRNPRLRFVVVALVFLVLLFVSGCGGGGPAPAESPSPSPSPSLPVYNRTKNTYYATIQAAIDDARNGDTIVVSQGTYNERINFRGKNIVVQSERPLDAATVAQTIIDGGGNGPVVMFVGGETNRAALLGVTVRNGDNPGIVSGLFGGGICIRNASPIIRFVRVINNRSPRGGGIYVTGTSTPVIVDCEISGNRAMHGPGGGIMVDGGASPAIYRNQITNNRADGTPSENPYGGGIYVSSSASVRTEGGTNWPRSNCPPAGTQSGNTWTYQNNTFSGNTHMNGQSTNGCHVYFE